MIFSRLCLTKANILCKLATSVMFAASFEKVKVESAKKLNEKIAKAHNIQSLFKVYELNRNDFTPFLLQASRKITHFLENNDQYDREMLFKLYNSFSELKPSQLSDEEIRTVLTLFRKLEMIGFRNQGSFKSNLLQATKKIIGDKSQSEAKDIQDLFTYYEICSYFQDFLLQKAISTKIYYFISKSISKKQQINISLKAINNFLKGIYYVEQLSMRQKLIRGSLLAHIDSKLDTIQLQQVVEICCNLLRTDQLDFQNKELMVVNKIIEKLNRELENLSKSEMLKLLSIQDNRNNRTRLIYLYKSISTKLFELIGEDGKSIVPETQILDFLNFICYKIWFNILPEKHRDKFFLFVQRLFNNLAFNTALKPILTNLVTNILKNDFMEEKHRHIVQQIINKAEFSPNIQLVYQLAIRDYEISQALKKVILKKDTKVHKLFMLGIALKHCSKTNQDSTVQNLLNKVQANLENLLNTPQKFIKSILKINTYEDYDKLYFKIFKFFPHLMLKIQNPFETALKNYEYTIFYTQFVLTLLPHDFNNISKIFSIKEKQITDGLLKDLIMRELRKDKYTIKPNKQLFYLIMNKMEAAISNKNIALIKPIIYIMVRCSRFLVYKDLDIYLQEIMWKNLKDLVKNLPALFEMKLNKQVNILLSCYLSKNFRHYSHTKQFSDLVVRTLNHLPLLSQSVTTLNNLFKVALRMGVLEGKHCQDKALIENLNLGYSDKQKIKMLLDQKYQYQFDIQKAEFSDLQVLVFNKNSLQKIEQNIDKIQAKLAKYSDYQLVQLLVSFNLPNRPISRRLVHKILRTLLTNNKSMQQLDMGRVFLKSLEGFYFMIEEYNQLFYRLVNFYIHSKGRIKFLDTYTLIHFAKYVASQPEKKQTALFYNLVHEWFTMNTPYNQMLVLSSLVDTTYQYTSKEIQMIPKIIQIYFRAGIKMFLYLEDRIPLENRKEIVKQIVRLAQFSTRDHKQKIIQDLYYRYIKIAYPQETKNFNIEDRKLIEFKFSSKPNHTVMNALNDVKTKLGLEIKLHRQFGNNQVYQLNDTFIVFISPVKTSSIYQRKFIKKALKVISKRNIPVFDFLNSVVRDQQIYLKLIKSKGLLLSGQQVDELIQISQQNASVFNEEQTNQKEGKKL